MPPFFAGVIDAGLCSLVDCYDQLTLEDVADLNELLAVRAENERRADEHAERKR